MAAAGGGELAHAHKYVVDAAGDTVTEALNAGVDLVRSSVSFTLGANVDYLTLTGAAAIDGTGNSADADDRIIYNSANGALWYDADGTSAAPAVYFAQLSTGLALTTADFLVI
jgi:Ca2+-binding RTX toxin-like protein